MIERTDLTRARQVADHCPQAEAARLLRCLADELEQTRDDLQRLSAADSKELRRLRGRRDRARHQRDEAKARAGELIIALHDAINRPKGVVPDSALPYYQAALAARDESEAKQ